jgi:ribA/ribD-fused uncharacterized protein
MLPTAPLTPSPTSVADLLTLQASGYKIKFLFFWGHQPQRDGSPGPGCLSQWWPSPFEVDGRRFATAEHFMMWSKAMLFGDEACAAEILEVDHPNLAKALGRKVKPFDVATWERERLGIVVAGSIAKFSQHADLKTYLLGTGNRVLVEASPRDRVWGIGMGASNPDATDPARWRGLNLLGFALMRARLELFEAPGS